MADKDYLKELTRRALIRNPNISCRALAKLLKVNKDFALKIRTEVVAERRKAMQEEIEKLKKRTLEEELVDMEEETKELVIELWKIISSGSPKDKTQAIRTLLQAREQLFSIKFDAGLFTRKLGESTLNIPGLVKLVKENVKQDRDNNQSSPEL